MGRGQRYCYALYKGDWLVGMGSKGYLASLLGVKKETIDNYATPTHRRRDPNGIALVSLGPLEDWER